jgi:uncharacterized protein YecE (DUF72 family)
MFPLRIGTSGFLYQHWREVFYPKDIPAKDWLVYYSRTFDTVELNNTFYRLPSDAIVDQWSKGTDDNFLFACKGSRFLTHVKRLKETKIGVKRFLKQVERLGPKLGPILWQLPPQMKKADLERLGAFLEALPRNHRYAFEFRDEAWYLDEVCDLLDNYGAAFCEHDLVKRAPPRHTGSFRYLRFHGATARYAGRYGLEGLSAPARDVRNWISRCGPAYVYFNNDVGGHALRDAQLFGSLVQPAPTPPLLDARL